MKIAEISKVNADSPDWAVIIKVVSTDHTGAVLDVVVKTTDGEIKELGPTPTPIDAYVVLRVNQDRLGWNEPRPLE